MKRCKNRIVITIGRKNSLSRVSKVTCGLLFCLTTCAFAVDGKVNMGSNGVDDKKVVPLVGTTKTKLDGVNQEGFKVKGQVSDNVGPLPGVNGHGQRNHDRSNNRHGRQF